MSLLKEVVFNLFFPALQVIAFAGAFILIIPPLHAAWQQKEKKKAWFYLSLVFLASGHSPSLQNSAKSFKK